MPCDDVTEIIEVRLDGKDRLLAYRLNKRSCGTEIGADSLLIGKLRDRSADEIIAIDPSEFCDDIKPSDEIGEFLLLKHLFALQSALKTLTGACPPGPGQQCAVSEIQCDENEINIRAHIAVEIVADQIRSCRPCNKCSTLEIPECRTDEPADASNIERQDP